MSDREVAVLAIIMTILLDIVIVVTAGVLFYHTRSAWVFLLLLVMLKPKIHYGDDEDGQA